MVTRKKNVPDPDASTLAMAGEFSFGIVVAEWNRDITASLLEGARNALIRAGVKPEQIIVKWVPGSFELTAGARYMAEYTGVDAVICLGCVIQGETPHFTYICQGITYGITELNLLFDLPFIFGVLTTLNTEQARERAGGKLGNKGEEAAITALRMAQLHRELEEQLPDTEELNEEELL
ncbi:MAG: 6,7-dimethyl-8-ribityllumazine synthase [Bacteroidales bacterium]